MRVEVGAPKDCFDIRVQVRGGRRVEDWPLRRGGEGDSRGVRECGADRRIERKNSLGLREGDSRALLGRKKNLWGRMLNRAWCGRGMQPPF